MNKYLEKIAATYNVRPSSDAKHFDKVKSVNLNHQEMKHYNKVSDKYIDDNAGKNVGVGTALGAGAGVAAGHAFNKNTNFGKKYGMGKRVGGYVGGLAGLVLGAKRVENLAHEKAINKTTNYESWPDRSTKKYDKKKQD